MVWLKEGRTDICHCRERWKTKKAFSCPELKMRVESQFYGHVIASLYLIQLNKFSTALLHQKIAFHSLPSGNYCLTSVTVISYNTFLINCKEELGIDAIHRICWLQYFKLISVMKSLFPVSFCPGIPEIIKWTLSGHIYEMLVWTFFFSFSYSFFNQGRKSVCKIFSILPQLVGSLSFAP